MKHTLLAISFLALFTGVSVDSSASHLSAERDARLRAAQAWMDFQLRDQFTPGASVALVLDQDVIWSHAYGYANLASAQRMTADHSYSICSISKLFTSIGVMTLVEEGKIALDAPLSDYLDGFELTATDETGESPITIRQLLSHSAGLPRETSGTHWNVITDMPTSDAVFSMLNQQQRLYAPYVNFQYSNLGMSLLGNLIAEVSGQDYHDYIEAAILKPLALAGISSELPLDYDNGRFAVGYKYHAGESQRDVWDPYQMRGYAPAAGYAASVLDLAAFASWHFRLLETGEEEVLKRDTLKEMLRVQFTDPFDPDSPRLGLGYFFSPLAGEMTFGHGGYCPGYRAAFAVDPKQKLALIGMVNTNDVNPRALVNGVVEIAAASVVAAVETGDDPGNKDSSEKEKHNFYQYEGQYAWAGYNSATYVIPAADGIVLIDLADSSAGKNATTFTHVEGDTFRRERKEGDLGETLTFLRNRDGDIVSYSSHGFVRTKQ